jgi:hypothetical protein
MLAQLEPDTLVSIDGIRHKVTSCLGNESVSLMNCITMKEREWAFSELQSLRTLSRLLHC